MKNKVGALNTRKGLTLPKLGMKGLLEQMPEKGRKRLINSEIKGVAKDR